MKSIFPKVLIITIIILSIGTILNTSKVYAEVLKPNPIETTLDPNSTYTVTGDVFVNAAATLTIPAGTKLLFSPNARLVVYGKLIANGTAKNHITISESVEQKNIISAVNTNAKIAIPVTEAVQTPEVVFPEVSTPQVASPDIAPLTVSMGLESAVQQKHSGITFMANAAGTLSYVDIADAKTAITVDHDVVLDASHTTFTNCDKGITNSFGTVTLTHSTFIDTIFPGQIDIYGTFTHSDTTFLGKGFKGWNYGGNVAPGKNYHFNSRDGEYYIFGISVLNGGTLTIDYGVTVFIQDGFSLNVLQGGTVVVNGTEASPVNFYGDGSCPLGMSAIIAGPYGEAKIKYTNFHNLCGGIKSTASTITITHSTFKDISGTAIIAEQQGDTTITDSDFTTSKIAIVLNNPVIKNISQNYFHGNTAGVSVIDMTTATIKNNGWGSDSGPRIKDNPGGKGDSIVVKNTNEVIYRPWLGMLDDTTPPVSTTVEQNPVIIVPGITGSVLTKDYDDKSELWPNIAKLALSPTDAYLNDLSLLQSGTQSSSRPVVVGDIVRSASKVDIFAGMIDTFNKNGYVEGTNLFVFPYDWRLSNTINQKLLKDFVSTVLAKSGKKKVNIIAHSMGGLMVQDYIAENTDSAIDHIFYIAVPHLGAPKTFKTVMYGDDMGFRFSVAGLFQVPVLNEQRVKIITQNMPAVYELLPSKKYIESISHYIQDRSQSNHDMGFDDIQKYMTTDGRNEKMFAFASQLHNKVDNSNPSAETYNFAGCGNTKTITGFTLTKEQSLTLTGFKIIPEHRISYGSGDGVVPIASAIASTVAHNYYISTGSHGTMPSLPQVQNAILDILQGKNITTTNALSDQSAICTLEGNIIEVHSPVSLDIYDEQGRHTGITVDGIEYGIPNVQYDVINDEKIVFLPSGQRYKIIQRAESAGAYDMYISHVNGSDIVDHQAYYHAVPMASNTTIGTFTLDKELNPDIMIDDNGDGTTDRLIKASSLLDKNQASDANAPITVASYADGLITLKTVDDNSGVLNIKYSTDNSTWKIYDKPFAGVVGTTVYFVSIDNAGNTEEIKEFRIDTVNSPPATVVGNNGNNNISIEMQSTKKDDSIDEMVDDTVSDQDVSNSEKSTNKKEKVKSIKKVKSPTIRTSPAPDEGTVMQDPEVTLKGISTSAAGIAALGPGKVIIIGLLAIGTLVLLALFSKKRS